MYGGARAEKQRIRQEARIISEGLTPEYRREASREITRQVLALPEWKEASTVMAYWSLPTEPDTRELLKDLTDVKPGTLGIPEPEMTADGAEIPEPDLILVPCMAAAPNGVRLGHGAGYYDRFLAGHTGRTICLCFRALLRGDLPTEGTDIITDLVVSD